MGPKTIYDKLFDRHVAVEKDDDRHIIHEVSSPQAFAGLEAQGRSVRRPDLTLATSDHNVPTTPRPRRMKEPTARLQVQTLERNVKAHGIQYLGLNSKAQGIVHVIGPELGFTLPGTTLVCGDSHTSTHGAFGALAFGIGTSEVEHVLATQTVSTSKWKNVRVWVEGALCNGVGSKDLMLYIINKIGTAGGTGAAVEFAGPTIESLSMEARMSLCNMTIEAGARAGIIAPDDVTFEYIKGRPLAPDASVWDEAVHTWRRLKSDPEARFDQEIKIDATDVTPTVTWGTSPEHAVHVGGLVPHPESFREESKQLNCKQALQYMGLEAGTRMTDIPIDKVFIGSCTNARLEDLRSAANILRGRKISPNIKAALAVPGSGIVKQQAESEGLDRVFINAGFEWREPGCSLCIGLNEDQLNPYERSASTSNRNFENRQGTAGRTHLMSPAMAAAAAVQGKITDVRDFHCEKIEASVPLSYPDNLDDDSRFDEPEESSQTSDRVVETVNKVFRSVEGYVAIMDRANVDTDCILPKQFCTTIVRTGLRDGLFHNLRWSPEGKPEPSFVLNQKPYDKASVLLCTKPNFGCGSSREHAVWALVDFGITCVLAPSFADIFFNNSFQNGLLPGIVNNETISAVEIHAQAGRKIKVDLESQSIFDDNGAKIGSFEVDQHRKQRLLEGLDEISTALLLENRIAQHESQRKTKWPWLDTCVTTGWGKLLGQGKSRLPSVRQEPELNW
ncbi:uncharacterized protein TRUGW13939_08759 [Talaromyces rugulosus]|uniref:3-isopropylmalate dehydratase n=1 Tax=Talaromyces rugulosus TaxID=121627 RepID=A0A7H8R5X8_TALRU|nr:uncharacterized protein TRUGW13939_08759 [Talaromyces rugulosus]QKX61607.1 hypothetical protein TRUGW13939_08759 [Talaromyces rugulosus]